MKNSFLIFIFVLSSVNVFASESFKAECALRSFDLKTRTFDPGSVTQPLKVIVDENNSVKLGEFQKYEFYAKSSSDGVRATAVDKKTNAEISPVVVDGSRYSILEIIINGKQIVMDCSQIK